MGLNQLKEIEVKIMNEDKNKIIKVLKSFGAKKKFDGNIRQIIFDTKNHELKNKEITLRLRMQGKQNILTLKLKDKTKGVKSATELEVEIKDFDKVYEIILGLGYIASHEVHKRRESYKLKWQGHDYLVEFDKFLGKYKKVPPFFEVEAKNKKLLYMFLTALGIDKKNISLMNGAQLIKKYYPNALK